MRNIYYGQIRESFVNVYENKLRELKHNIRFNKFSNYNKVMLENGIKNNSSGYVRKSKRVIENNIYIMEKNHNHECDIDDKVILGVYEGKVTDKTYDAINNTTHYYTDIVVEDIEKEGIEEELNEKKVEVTNELQQLYNTNFKIKDLKPRRGFFQRLLDAL